jgi:hypothetical protein
LLLLKLLRRVALRGVLEALLRIALRRLSLLRGR